MRLQALGAMALLTIAIAPARAAPGAAIDNTYVNQRFGYVIDWPAGWVAEPEAENGDGRVFHPRGSKVQASAWGAYNSLEQTPAQMLAMNAEDCKGAPLAYRVVKPKLVAFSCRVGPDVLYQKTLIRGDVITSFRMTYPAAEAARWEPVVQRMAGSMRAGTPED
jgi:hypothetical protein